MNKFGIKNKQKTNKQTKTTLLFFGIGWVAPHSHFFNDYFPREGGKLLCLFCFDFVFCLFLFVNLFVFVVVVVIFDFDVCLFVFYVEHLFDFEKNRNGFLLT